MTKLNLFKIDRNVQFKGDNVVARTIQIGQTVTVKDRVVIDSENFAVTTLGVGSVAGKWTFKAGLTSPTGSSSGSNEALGDGALGAITSGFGNTAAGNGALSSLTTAGNNVAIGRNAGRDVTGSSNVFIGDGVADTEVAVSNKLRIHNTGGAVTPIVEGSMGVGDNRLGVNTKTLNAKLNVVVGASDAHDAIELTQNDNSRAFGNLVATSAASTVNPLTTFTTGNTIQGFARVKINGTARWIPFYNDPTS